MSFESKDSHRIASEQASSECASPMQLECFDHKTSLSPMKVAQDRTVTYPKPDVYQPIEGLSDALVEKIRKEVIKNMQDTTNPPPIVTDTPK